MQKVAIFDIETFASEGKLLYKDFVYLKDRKIKKTEDEIIDSLSLNFYLSHIIAISLVYIDTNSNSIEKTLVWYLTETEEIPFNEEVSYMGKLFRIDYFPVKFQQNTSDDIFHKERDLIEKFLSEIEHNSIKKLVSFNGKSFDVNFIFIRGMIHGINLPEWIITDPKNSRFHVDICQFLSRGTYEGKYSLDFISRQFGLKSSKEKYSGDSVKEMFMRERYIAIAKYCSMDSILLAPEFINSFL